MSHALAPIECEAPPLGPTLSAQPCGAQQSAIPQVVLIGRSQLAQRLHDELLAVVADRTTSWGSRSDRSANFHLTEVSAQRDLAVVSGQCYLAVLAADDPALVEQIAQLRARVDSGALAIIVYADPPTAAKLPGQAGWDDVFVTVGKPDLFAPRLDLWLQVFSLKRTALGQQSALEAHRERTEDEMRAAERLFSSIVHPGCLNGPNFRYLHTAMSVFNGDLLLAAPTVVGGLRVLLGDFTGHGLVAAVGALPAAEIFYGMTKKGFSLGEVAREINEKLRRILPRGRFLAAALLELDASHTELAVWSGGIPDIFVRDGASGDIRLRHPPQHLPLAVVDSDQMDLQVAYYDCMAGDRIYAYSDGILEAENAGGERFGVERLVRCFGAGVPRDGAFDEIAGAVSRFRAGHLQSDDVTLLEVKCDPELAETQAAQRPEPQPPVPARCWEIRLDLDAEALRTSDPLPLLTPLLLEYQGLAGHWSHIFTVLSELYSNALDHGVLGLDSQMKSTAVGFARYYQERATRLMALEQGSIQIGARHRPDGRGGGELELSFADSGPGFAWHEAGSQGTSRGEGESSVYAGRGLELLRSLCSTVEFFGAGNRVRAVYAWH